MSISSTCCGATAAMGLVWEELDNVESTLMWLLGEIQFRFRFLFSKPLVVDDFGEEHALLPVVLVDDVDDDVEHAGLLHDVFVPLEV